MSDVDYCSCDYTDCDPVKFSSVRHVKAVRKRHNCLECNGPIYLGESCTYIAYCLYDGELDDYRVCFLCEELEQWARISVPCFCSMTGELLERVRAMVNDTAPKVPGFFFEYGRRMVKIRERKRIADEQRRRGRALWNWMV